MMQVLVLEIGADMGSIEGPSGSILGDEEMLEWKPPSDLTGLL